MGPVNRTKTIPAAEQLALCRRAQAGDLAARNTLATASMGLVYSIAKRWVASARNLELDDLAAEGAIGLFRAIEKFDCDRGLAFTTYASHWIKNSIRLAHSDDAGIRRGEQSRAAFVRDVRLLVHAGETRERAIALVAERAGSKLDTVLAVVEAFERDRPRSLDAPLKRGEEGTLADVLAADIPDPDGAIDGAARDRAVRTIVAALAARLPARERAILQQRVLRVDDDRAILADLGRQFSITRERIRQLETVVVKKLQKALEGVRAEYDPAAPAPRAVRRRKAFCAQDHEMVANCWVDKYGKRHCRECAKERSRGRRVRARERTRERESGTQLVRRAS
jgi:RNA polymerase sigma factor (sigma-70 family)